MTATLHIVGAGVSGLAAAYDGSGQGWQTVVHESSPQAGGRCRTLVRNGLTYDNGTHVLLGANPQALKLLSAVGASANWVEPEPLGLPVVDLETHALAHVGLSPWSWRSPARRPPGVGIADLARLLPMAAAPQSRTVASYAGRSTGMATFLEAMSVAVLNTPAERASARMLGRVLRRLLAPGASRLLVAREGLGPDLIQPVQHAVRRRGGTLRFGQRLHALRRQGDRIDALIFNDHVIELQPADRVVLALPPHAIAGLLPELEVADRFEPIVNLHWAHRGHGPIRFVGLTGGLAQWMLVRPGVVSVTISAAGEAAFLSVDELASRVWPEVQAAASRLAIDLPGVVPAELAMVKEKMATPAQDCAYAARRRPQRQPLANLTLAGDWMSGLPATIEGAVVAGRAAVAKLGRVRPKGIRHGSDQEAVA